MVTLNVIGNITHLAHLPRGSLCSMLLWFHPLERGKETLLKKGEQISLCDEKYVCKPHLLGGSCLKPVLG